MYFEQIFSFSCLFVRLIGIVPSSPSMTGSTVIFTFHNFYSSLTRSRHVSCLSHLILPSVRWNNVFALDQVTASLLGMISDFSHCVSLFNLLSPCLTIGISTSCARFSPVDIWLISSVKVFKVQKTFSPLHSFLIITATWSISSFSRRRRRTRIIISFLTKPLLIKCLRRWRRLRCNLWRRDLIKGSKKEGRQNAGSFF